MFVFEFEKPLFEFAYERPHCEPLFALPPTCSSSTVCYLSFVCPAAVVAINAQGRLYIYPFTYVFVKSCINRFSASESKVISASIFN